MMRALRTFAVAFLQPAAPQGWGPARALTRRLLVAVTGLVAIFGALEAFAQVGSVVGAASSLAGGLAPATTFQTQLIFKLVEKGVIWVDKLQSAAKVLFFMLVAIEIAWTAIRLTLEQADLQSWTAAVVKKLLVLSIFYAILTFGVQWMGALIALFAYAGFVEGGGGVLGFVPGGSFLQLLQADYFNPMGMVKRGVEIAIHVLGLAPNAAGGPSGGLAGGARELGRDPNLFGLRDALALAILGMYVGIGAQMFLYFFETIFVLTAGLFFLGFGGAKFTETYVMRYIGYGFGVGVKIFVFYLILSIALPAMDSLADDIRNAASSPEGLNILDALVMGGAVTMLTILLRAIPSIAASLSTSPGATADGGVAQQLAGGMRGRGTNLAQAAEQTRNFRDLGGPNPNPGSPARLATTDPSAGSQPAPPSSAARAADADAGARVRSGGAPSVQPPPPSGSALSRPGDLTGAAVGGGRSQSRDAPPVEPVPPRGIGA